LVIALPEESAYGKFAVKLVKKTGVMRSLMRIDQPRRRKAWHNRSSPENGWASWPRFTILRRVSG
jgi:hypothetical protein